MYTTLHASWYQCFIQRGLVTCDTSKLEILVSCKEVVVPLFHQGVGVGSTPVSSKGMGTAILSQGDRFTHFIKGVGGTPIYICYSSGYSYSSDKGYPRLLISMWRNSEFREVWKYHWGPAFCLENGRINNPRNIHIFTFWLNNWCGSELAIENLFDKIYV